MFFPWDATATDLCKRPTKVTSYKSKTSPRQNAEFVIRVEAVIGIASRAAGCGRIEQRAVIRIEIAFKQNRTSLLGDHEVAVFFPLGGWIAFAFEQGLHPVVNPIVVRPGRHLA